MPSSHHHTRHVFCNINYHFMLTPKYRRGILRGLVSDRCRRLIYEVADANGFSTLSVEVS